MKSWEYKLEAFAIVAATLAAEIPATLPKVHHDDADQAQTERLIFKATEGEEDPAGSQVYSSRLDIELRTTSRNAEQIDEIFAAIIAAFSLPEVINATAPMFPGGLWYLQEQSDNSREDTKDTRKRARTYLFSVAHIEGAEP